MAVNACKDFFEGEVYGSIRHSEVVFICAYAELRLVYRCAFYFLGGVYGGLSRSLQKVASC